MPKEHAQVLWEACQTVAPTWDQLGETTKNVWRQMAAEGMTVANWRKTVDALVTTKLRGFAIVMVNRKIVHVSMGSAHATLEALRNDENLLPDLSETAFIEIDYWAKANGYQPKERRRAHPPQTS